GPQVPRCQQSGSEFLRGIQAENRRAWRLPLGPLGRYTRDGRTHRRRNEGDHSLHSLRSPERKRGVHLDGQAFGRAGGFCQGVLRDQTLMSSLRRPALGGFCGGAAVGFLIDFAPMYGISYSYMNWIVGPAICGLYGAVIGAGLAV